MGTTENCATQDREMTFEEICKALRADINHKCVRLLELKVHKRFTEPEKYVGQHSQMKANIMLSYRHLEDARMRVGKVLQYADDGISILDKPPHNESGPTTRPGGFAMTKVLLSLVITALVFVMGCNESQKQWGEGDPPADYIESFGNENTARLSYVLEQRLIKIQALIHGVDTKDKAGKLISHQPGIINYLANFENRLKALEDPNDVRQKSVEKRVKELAYVIGLEVGELQNRVNSLEKEVYYNPCEMVIEVCPICPGKDLALTMGTPECPNGVDFVTKEVLCDLHTGWKRR